MHKSLNKFVLAGAAAAFALTPAIAAAQDDTLAEGTQDTAETAAEDPRLASLPADKQAAVASWPAETQEYYWSLTDERQQMFWSLSDSDKVRLSQMPDDQRESTWAQIESSVAPSQG